MGDDYRDDGDRIFEATYGHLPRAPGGELSVEQHRALKSTEGIRLLKPGDGLLGDAGAPYKVNIKGQSQSLMIWQHYLCIRDSIEDFEEYAPEADDLLLRFLFYQFPGGGYRDVSEVGERARTKMLRDHLVRIKNLRLHTWDPTYNQRDG